MSAIKPNALSDVIGYLYVAPVATPTVFTRLGSVRGLISSATIDKTDIKADDTGTVLSLSKPDINISCTFLENADTEVMDLILPGTRTTTASSAVSVTGEIISSTGKSKGDVYILENKNGDDTVCTSITVDDNGSALVLDTNYTVNVDTDGSITGEIGNTYITFLTDTSANQIDVDYSYTPNASTTFTITKEQTSIPEVVVKIVGTENGKDRTITINPAVLTGDYAIDFLDAVEAGDLNGATLNFQLQDGGTFTYNDEIDV